MPARVTVQAPAKINLTLDAVGRRADGYHLLESVMQTVSIRDTLIAERAEDITVETPGAALCPPEKNTAYRAAEVFFAAVGVRGGVRMTVDKQIPVQAGMGGGSADAAAALLALDRLYDTHLDSAALCALGEKVGADVPFCLVGGTAMVTGIGERIAPLPALPDCTIVIAQPDTGVSTAAAYAALDAATITARPDHPALLRALACGDLAAVCRQTVNVFEEAIALPGVTAIRRQMAAFSPLTAQMTGSGSAVFAVFVDEASAAACAAALGQEYPVVRVCHPCAGPIIA